MKWWQVAIRVNTHPGLNGDKIQIIFDVEAETRPEAEAKALQALMHRAEVEFAIAEA